MRTSTRIDNDNGVADASTTTTSSRVPVLLSIDIALPSSSGDSSSLVSSSSHAKRSGSSGGGRRGRRKRRTAAVSIITVRHWMILLLGSFLTTGNYYNYDLPGAVSVPLQTWLGSDYDTFQWQLNILYSVYSVPNILLPIIGGHFVDSLGPMMMLVLFVSLVCIGQLLVAIGLSVKSFIVILLGRTVFGLGGETLEVAFSRILTDWFKGRGLAFALGLNLTFARLATGLGSSMHPRIATAFSPAAAGWTGAAVCGLSLLSCFIIIVLDRDDSRRKAGVKVLKKPSNPLNEEEERLIDAEVIFEVVHDAHEPSSSSTLNTSNSERPPLADNGGYESEEFDAEDETVHFAQALSLGHRFYVLAFVVIVLYAASIPFFHICSDFFQKKFKLDTETAGLVMALPDYISAFVSPLTGILIDYTNSRTPLLIVSTLLLTTSHALMFLTTLPPQIGMAFMGASFGIFAAGVWPCVPFLVGAWQVATGFGVLTVALNVSLAGVPMIVAAVRGAFGETGTGILFLGLSASSCLACILLWWVAGGILDKPFADSGAISSTSANAGEAEDVDSDFESEDEEVKVVGEGGLSVVVPHTVIHHHHHRRITEGQGSFHADQVHQHHDVECHCHENNGVVAEDIGVDSASTANLRRRRSKSLVRPGSPVRRTFHLPPERSSGEGRL